MLTVVVHDPYSRELVENWVVERGESVFAALGVTPPGEAVHPWKIRIEVEGFSRTYAFKISAERGHKAVSATPSLIQCQKCSSAEFLDRVEEELRIHIAKLQAASTPPAARVEQPPPSPAEPQPLATPLRPQTKRGRKLGPLGIVGIPVAAAGIPLLTIGAIRFSKGTEYIDTPQASFAREYRTPATNTMLGVGIGLLAAGTTMILVDLLVCRKRSAGCKKPIDNRAQLLPPFTLTF